MARYHYGTTNKLEIISLSSDEKKPSASKATTIISCWVRRDVLKWRSFGLKIMVLPRATPSIGNSIVAWKLARFAANNVKGRQVASGNWSQFPVKTTQVER